MALLTRLAQTLAMMALALGACHSFALAQGFNEYQLKAVFLFRFAQFVEWPTNAAQPNAPFAICVLGDDPFENHLDETVRNESVQNRQVTVRRYREPGQIRECQIVFISNSERARVKTIAAELRSRGALTVSDSEDFAQQGGMIELVTADKRIRLKINVEAARAANLQISSKLLRPATIVSSGG